LRIEMDEETLEELKRIFSRVEGRAKLFFFKDASGECEYCKDLERILEKLASLHDGLELAVLSSESEEAEKYEIPMFPAILIHGAEEFNVRFFGAPIGYEFAVLIEDLVDALRGRPELSREVAERVEEIDKRVWIRVFVTPSCPYCPIAVRTAHKFAMLNKNIIADAIDATEFRELAEKYGVFAVPKVVINDRVEFEGAVPDRYFLLRILEAVQGD